MHYLYLEFKVAPKLHNDAIYVHRNPKPVKEKIKARTVAFIQIQIHPNNKLHHLIFNILTSLSLSSLKKIQKKRKTDVVITSKWLSMVDDCCSISFRGRTTPSGAAPGFLERCAQIF